MPMRLQPRVVHLVAFLTPIIGQYAPGATFHGLGFLPGTSSSTPTAISADGSTVVGHSGNSPFRWTALSGMELFTGGDTPTAISADGSVIVGSLEGRAFRWSQANGTTDLGMLRGDYSATATGVSADGAIVVGTSVPYSDGGTAPPHAFRWTRASGMQDMHAPYDASGVSADGSTVVGGNHRWTAATSWQYLGRFHPTAVNADGSCIVGTAYSGGGFGDFRGDTPPESQAWRWTPEGGAQLLLRKAVVADVSDDGAILATTITPPTLPINDWRASVWDASHGNRDLRNLLVDQFHLDLTGWTLTQSLGISADGSTLIGSGVDPAGRTEGWIAVIPEPGTAMALVGIGMTSLRRRRTSHIRTSRSSC